jgi:four helix bundle protein
MAKSFKDLVAFQRALDVVVAVYDVTANFPKEELYGLTPQMRRASIGVISDIAEGQGRLGYGEWRQFLSQARGSLFEVEAQCIAAERLHFLNEPELAELTRLIRRAGRALSGLIDWVRSKERSTKQPSNSATKQPAATATRPTPRANPPAPPPRT